MKLWLKGQSMISILQRFRYLLQDLNIDDKDYVNALKVCFNSIYLSLKNKFLANPRNDSLC
jgi:hypothetical protein